MSFLLAEDDPHETLQVALAFIDACEGGDGSLITTASSSSSSCRRLPVGGSSDIRGRSTVATVTTRGEPIREECAQWRHDQAQSRQEESRDKGSTRAGRTAGSETQLRMRRDEQRGRSAFGDQDRVNEPVFAKIQLKAPASFWLEMVLMQKRARLKSQQRNAELKDAVSKQTKLAKSLEVMLSKKMSQFGLDLLQDVPFLNTNSVLSHGTGVVTDLQLRVHQMHVEVESLFTHPSWLEIADSVGCMSRLKQDVACGPMVELRMNTPLSCSVRAAGDSLWRRTIEASAVVQTSNYHFELLTKSSYRKRYTIILDSPDGLLELNGMSYVQRFSGADRDAYIWASAIFLLNQGEEVIREKGWMVACSSMDTSLQTTLFRGYYEVFWDGSSRDEGEQDNATASAERKAQREFVLNALGNRTRGWHQHVQTLLLDEFAGYTGVELRFQLDTAISC